MENIILIVKKENMSSRYLTNLCIDISSSQLYHELVIAVMELMNDNKVLPASFEEMVLAKLESDQWKRKLRKYIYQHMVKHPVSRQQEIPWPKEPLDYIHKSQISWERRVFKSLNSMCAELGLPLSRKRPVSEQRDLEAKWSELSSEDMDLTRIRPLYSPKDFLDVILNIRSPNLSASSARESGSTNIWGQIKTPLKVKTLAQLKRQFQELCCRSAHLDIDDRSDNSCVLLNERLRLGKIVMEEQDPLIAREYTKLGCPPGFRLALWSLILGTDINPKLEELKFNQLKYYVLQHDMIVDKLIFKDIRLTSSNDDQYFVFEDVLYQVLLSFSRDTSVLSHFRESSASAPTAYLRGKTDCPMVIYPPNGIIPFHGFSMYVAPLCFLTEDSSSQYSLFRELYCRFFFRLHTVSSHCQGILSLCLLTEALLQELDPQLTYHFANQDIQPLKIIMKWIMRCFSGYLCTEQLLFLWDRILAYDTLEILAALSAAILVYRKHILMQAENQATAESMLCDISSIRVVPLLTWIFRGSTEKTSSRIPDC